jgi:hypothetical protein
MENEAWNTAKSFTDLLLLNCDYLRGGIASPPYSDKPIKEETSSLREKLLELHENGVFTYCSKPCHYKTWLDGLGIHWEQQQREFVCTIIYDPGLLNGILERLLQFEMELEIWADQVNPIETVKLNTTRSVVRQRHIGGRVWDDKLTLSNNHTPDLVLSHLPAVAGKRLWSLDVASKSWEDTHEVIAKLLNAARAAWTLRLENLPLEMVEIFAPMCNSRVLACLRRTSRTLCSKTEAVVKRRFKRFSCLMIEEERMQRDLSFFIDARAQSLRNETEVLHLILPHLDRWEDDLDRKCDRTCEFLEQLILAATRTSPNLHILEIEPGSPLSDDHTPVRCMAYVLLLVAQLPNKISSKIQVLVNGSSVYDLRQACCIFGTARRQTDPFQAIRNQITNNSISLFRRENLSNLLENCHLPIHNLCVALYVDSDAVQLERFIPKINCLESLTIQIFFLASATATRIALLSNHLLATTVKRLVIYGSSFDTAAFTEACTSYGIAMPLSRIELHPYRGITVAAVRSTGPNLFINRYVKKGLSIYMAEYHCHSTDSPLEESYSALGDGVITGVSACTYRGDYIRVGSLQQGWRGNSWISRTNFNQIARAKDIETLRSLLEKQYRIARRAFMRPIIECRG